MKFFSQFQRRVFLFKMTQRRSSKLMYTLREKRRSGRRERQLGGNCRRASPPLPSKGPCFQVLVVSFSGVYIMIPHTIHGTGIFTYIWLIFMVHVGKYPSPMDCLGTEHGNFAARHLRKSERK